MSNQAVAQSTLSLVNVALFNVSLYIPMTACRHMGNTDNPLHLPWSVDHLPRLGEHFKKVVRGKHVVMGKKIATQYATHELLDGCKRKLVLAREKCNDCDSPNWEYVPQQDVLNLSMRERVVCIGGVELLNSLYIAANELFFVVVEAELGGNIQMMPPNFKKDRWVVEYEDRRRRYKYNKYGTTIFHCTRRL